jgi:hypothetical protein
MRLSRRALVAAAIVGLALVALALMAPSLYEVQDRGRDVVPYPNTGEVYKLRVLDTVTVYADGQSRPIPDKISSAGLVAAATMTLMAALLLAAAGAGRRKRRFYAFATAGLAFLAVDETFAVHQTIGHNLGFLADLPGVDRPDDVVFALFGVAALAFVWSFRDILLSRRRPTQLFVLGGAFFGIAVLGDVTSRSFEEPAEIMAAGFILAGLIILTAGILRLELGLGLPASAPGHLDDPDRAGTPAVAATSMADAEPVHGLGKHQGAVAR